MKSDLDILWESVEGTLFCSRAEYEAQLSGWTITRMEHIIRVHRGPEFHIVPIGNIKSATRKDIRDCIQPLIDEYGYALTRAPKSDTRQHRFNRLVGFFPIGEDELDVHYRIERLRHV